MPDPSDAELLRRFVAGDESAFTQLVNRHADIVYRTCMRMLHGSTAAPEDAAQVVFLVAARKAAGLDGRSGLGPWFYRTAVMVARNARRSEERRIRRESRESPAMTNTDPEREWDDAKPLLDEAIQSLGRKQREAVVLHFLQGISQLETGRQLGCSESAVRQRLEGALTQLRRYLGSRQVDITSAGLVAQLGRDLATNCPQTMRDQCMLAHRGVHALQAASAKTLAAQVLSPIAGMVTAGAATVLMAGLITSGILLGGIRAPKLHADPAASITASSFVPTSPPQPVAPPVALRSSSVSGIVIDATTGQPVAGIDVSVRQVRRAHLPAVPGARTVFGQPVATSDAHGRYQVQFLVTVPDIQEIEVDLASEKYSFNALSTMVYRGESVEVEPMRLTPCVQVQVKITDDQGHPIARAVINDGSLRNLISGPDGIFTDPYTIPERFYDVAAPGYRQTRITLRNGPAGPSIPSFPLSPGPTISGRVDLPAGTSAEGLEVAAGYSPYLSLLPVWRTPVDAHGGFAMRTAPREGAAWWLFVVRGSLMAGKPMPVTTGSTPVVLSIYETGTIHCDVRDASGAPVVGARVSSHGEGLDQTEASNVSRTALTDDQGQATLDWVPVGPVQVQVDWIDTQSNQRLLLPHQTVEVVTGQNLTLAHPLIIQAAPAEGPCVQGILRDAHSCPALHVLVGAVLKRGSLQQTKLYRGQAYTQEDGRFIIEMAYDSGERTGPLRFEPSPPALADQVHVVASLEGYNQTILDVTHGYPQGADQQDLGVIALDLPRRRTITVTAHRAGGGVPEVTVDRCIDGAGHEVPMRRLEGYWSKLDDPVRRQDILLNGVGTLLVHDELGNQARVAIPAGEKGVSVQVDFPQGRHFHATVRDELDHPIASLKWFGHSSAPPWCIPPQTVSGIWCNTPGVIDKELAVQAQGTYLFFLDMEHEVVTGTISPGSMPIIRDVRFTRALGHLHGHIRDASGHPAAAANASVTFTCDQGLEIQKGLTLDAEGTFDTTLPSGVSVTVNALYLGGMDTQQGSSAKVAVTPGVSTEIEVVLHPLFPMAAPAPAPAASPQAPARPPANDF